MKCTNTNPSLLALFGLLGACSQGQVPHREPTSPGHEALPTAKSAELLHGKSPGVERPGTRELLGAAPHHGPSKGKILMVAANPTVSKQTGWPVGYWAAELTHPYHEFVQAGYEVTIASPQGGPIQIDAYSDPTHESGYSAHDLLSLGFLKSPPLAKLTENTTKLSEVELREYDALFLVGGQSPMYTFRGNEELMDVVAAHYESGKPTAIVCHATAILLDLELSTGKPLVEGKTWTGFADAEEEIADKAVGQRLQPFWIESEARKMKNTSFVVKAPFTPYAIRDGNLITGQQQYSGETAARLVLDTLEGR